MRLDKLPLSFFVDKLNQREPISFARYGDGEFSAMLNRSGQNCDGSEYTPELGADLRCTLIERRDYLYALSPISLRRLGKEIMNFQRDNHIAIRWYSTETFLDASVAGELFPFVKALRNRKAMLVAPRYLENFAGFNAVFVEVPRATAHQSKDTIRENILREAYLVDVILFSAGMTSNVLIWELFPHLGVTHSLIDCGSLWDMYAGQDTRGYARKMSLARKDELYRLNFEGAKELI